MAKKDYSKLNKEELLEVIKNLESKKKYGLVWDEEKVPEKVVVDCQHQLPVLKEVKDKEIITDPSQPTHILIEGDNYHALSVLNYTHFVNYGIKIIFLLFFFKDFKSWNSIPIFWKINFIFF